MLVQAHSVEAFYLAEILLGLGYGVYMGVDSTNPDAVKRHRPQGGATATGAV